MLINIDAKQLEWVTAIHQSQDPVGLKEVNNGEDQHSDNQTRFRLPTRTAAKRLLFTIIYGGDGYTLSNRADTRDIGSQDWWNGVIAEFYEKYQGLRKWHESLVERVIRNGGRLNVETGRTYEYVKEKRGIDYVWPKTKILNYPVQGMAADLVSIARVALRKELYDLEDVLWCNTVHDSIVIDTRKKNIERICAATEQVFADVPTYYKQLFGVPFTLPVRCDIEVGMDWKNLQPYKEWLNAN